ARNLQLTKHVAEKVPEKRVPKKLFRGLVASGTYRSRGPDIYDRWRGKFHDRGKSSPNTDIRSHVRPCCSDRKHRPAFRQLSRKSTDNQCRCNDHRAEPNGSLYGSFGHISPFEKRPFIVGRKGYLSARKEFAGSSGCEL